MRCQGHGITPVFTAAGAKDGANKKPFVSFNQSSFHMPLLNACDMRFSENVFLA